MPQSMMKKQHPSLNCLPDEILTAILELLPVETLVACERVCRRWKRLVLDRTLWACHLVMFSANPIDDEKFFPLLSSQGKYIAKLTLNDVTYYYTIKFLLECCENITSLELVKCTLEQNFETDLKRCINLEELDIRTCDLVDESSDIAINFKNFSNLSSIYLSNFGLSSSNCDTLLECHQLSYIYIEKIKCLNLEFIRNLILSKQSILRALHIDGGAAVDDKCLQLLSQCEQLEDLAIADCHNLTDEGLVTLTNIRKLTKLKICNNVKFSENCLWSVFRCENLHKLKSLDLSGIKNVTVDVINVISEFCTNVQYFKVGRCPKLSGFTPN